jgi:hypothetical protein
MEIENNMKFTKLSEIVKAANVIRNDVAGKRTHYPIMFKKAVVVFWDKNPMTAEALAEAIGITGTTASNWKQQYDAGLYTAQGAYAVSKKSLKANNSILKSLKQDMVALKDKILLIEQCEAMGLTVSI